MLVSDLPKAVYARIAVNVPQVQGEFDYHLADDQQTNITLGQLVTVPFGKQNVQGVVIGFPEIPAVTRTKAVGKILDPDPVVTSYQIKLAQKINDNTLSPLGVTVHAMIPGGLSVRADSQYQLSETSLAAIKEGQPLLEEPSPSQSRLLNLLIERGPLRGRQLDRALPHKNWRATVGTLERRGIICSQTTLGEPSVRPKFEKRLKFIGDPSLALEQMDTLARKGFPTPEIYR